ncbi:MAG: PHP domain-containing protein [Pseudanabaena sp. ELA607]|jgi:predicted metal-dependent phosphoesterase TrpH
MVAQPPSKLIELNTIATTISALFASVDSTTCPKRCNFHLHTVHSDGKMLAEQVIDQAINLQVQHLAITDHHTVSGYFCAQKYLAQKQVTKYTNSPNLPHLWSGVEINASLLFTEVHILGYDFDPHHEAIQPYIQGRTTAGLEYQAISVIQALHRAGGLAVLAHPARYRRSPDELIPAAAGLGIDGIETYYGYDNSDPWRPSPRQTENIYHLGQQYGLMHTCGTDSHGFQISRRL